MVKKSQQRSGVRSVAASWAAVILLISALVTAVGCGEQDGVAAGSDRPVIVASLPPIASIARELVGDDAEVVTLLSAGSSPHGFAPKPDSVRALANATALLSVGQGVDPWADRAAHAAQPGLRAWSMQELVGADVGRINHYAAYTNDDHSDHGEEGHPWLDPGAVQRYVPILAERLAQSMPERSQEIQRRAGELISQIQAIEAEYQAKFARIPRKQLVTFHNAFDGLAEHFGLEVVAHLLPAGGGHGAGPTANRLARAVNLIRELELPVVYAEPQFPDRAMQAVQAETDAEVLQLDPLGRDGESYPELLRRILDTLVDGQTR